MPVVNVPTWGWTKLSTCSLSACFIAQDRHVLFNKLVGKLDLTWMEELVEHAKIYCSCIVGTAINLVTSLLDKLNLFATEPVVQQQPVI